MDPVTQFWIVVIPALVMGLPGIISLIMQVRSQGAVNRKTQAEAGSASGEAVNSFASAATQIAKINQDLQTNSQEMERKLDRMGERIGSLELLLESYARRIYYLMGGIDQLIRQIVGLNANPCWTPDDKWKPEDIKNDSQTTAPR
jgi:hypothetical protein